MKYLSNVLIIDDNLSEAQELKNIFVSRNIVPIIIDYTKINKNMNLNPDIICCDIMLNTLGNEEQNFKTISGLLKKILVNRKEYFFIGWTSGNNQLFQRLKQFLINDKDLYQPIQYYCFSKANFNVEKLEKSISKIRTKIIGLDILQYWKQNVNKALEKTISEIYKLSKDKNIKIIELLQILSQKTYGMNIKDNEGKSLNIYLQYILRDNIEKEMIESDEDILKKLSDQYNLKKRKQYELEAILNSLLHLDNVEFNGKNVYPGSFYSITKNKTWKHIFGKKVLSNSKFSVSKRKIETNNIINQALKNSINLKTQKQKEKRKKEIASISDKVMWGIVDITADCDFSNNKSGINKCVLAFLTPLNNEHLESALSKSPSFIRYKIAIKQNKDYKFFWLILCSKYLFGMHKEDIKSNSFEFRLRETLISSIRCNIYDCNSRLGTISF